MAQTFVRSDLSKFFSWWLGELQGLVPRSAAVGPTTAARLILSVESDGIRIVESAVGKTGRMAAPEGVVPVPAMLAYLSGVSRHVKPRTIGLRLPYSACFVRRLDLPAAARSDFASLLALDLERSTPFRVKDVLTALEVDPAPGPKGTVKVRHLIIKKKPIEGILTPIAALGFTVTRVECISEDGIKIMPVNFQAAPPTLAKSASVSNGLSAALGLAAAGLIASATYIYINQHETALQSVQGELDRLKAKVQIQKDALAKSQAAFAHVANVQKLRSEAISKVAILEELSHILPDTAWVTDLKIDGTTVDLSGLAVSAAALVPILERSKMLVDATSTASLTFDPREEKERFAIRARLRSAVPRTEGGGR